MKGDLQSPASTPLRSNQLENPQGAEDESLFALFAYASTTLVQRRHQRIAQSLCPKPNSPLASSHLHLLPPRRPTQRSGPSFPCT